MEYRQTDKMQELIDWEFIMPLPRYAGGHDEQMINLFKNSKLIAHYNEGDYQGTVATCVELADGNFAIYNDYYGSCSGCDAWEDALDEDVKKLCIDLANSTYIFKKLNDVKEFLIEQIEGNSNGTWSSWEGCANGLLDAINKGEIK